jgi:hypothetical protein
MFTPNQAQAAKELTRVCRPGGKIAMANWTPESFIGNLFKIIGKYVPPAPGIKSPALWGQKAHLDALFGSQATARLRAKIRFSPSRPAIIEIFRSYYGPVLKAFAAIDPAGAKRLRPIFMPHRPINTAKDGTLSFPRISRSGHHHLIVALTRDSPPQQSGQPTRRSAHSAPAEHDRDDQIEDRRRAPYSPECPAADRQRAAAKSTAIAM